MNPDDTPHSFPDQSAVMARALHLAERGEGLVEPNPLVGAVIVDSALRLVGEGWHERFGGSHAEVNALGRAGSSAAGNVLFVTLEPCCHFGKTPPCTEALIAAGIKRVVIAAPDPFPQVAGKGITRLREAGIQVEIGLLEQQARELTAPFRKLVELGTPFVHAKWAMTLDGKLASRTGTSRWISNPSSREIVQHLRGRMDAIVIGGGTAAADDPLLTARPAGPRTALRIVVDSQARLSLDSQLVRTANEIPVLVAASAAAPADNLRRLREAGVEVVTFPARRTADTETGTGSGNFNSGQTDVPALLRELGRRRFTNLLVEGGSKLLGSFFDLGLIDMAHVFVAPKLVGGSRAMTPLGGHGLAEMSHAVQLEAPQIQILEGDVYIRGRLK